MGGDTLRSQCIVLEHFGSADQIKISEAEVAQPRGSEVRVRVQAAGLSFTDVMIRNGKYPSVKKTPVVLGYDFVGEVEVVGPDVRLFKPGDLVADLTVTGAQCEYILRPESLLTHVPAGLEPAQAVLCVLPYVTAYQMMFRSADLREGDSFLVHGGGGSVGTAALDLARAYGLRAYATASESKHELVRSFGAVPIDYRKQDFVHELMRLEPSGVSAVFDPVGPENFKRSYKTLRSGGTLVIYGLLEDALGRGPGVNLALGAWYTGAKLRPDGRNIRSYVIAEYRKRKQDRFREDLSQLLMLLKQGRIAPVVDEVVGFFDVPEAHRRIEAGDVRGKIVLDPRRR